MAQPLPQSVRPAAGTRNVIEHHIALVYHLRALAPEMQDKALPAISAERAAVILAGLDSEYEYVMAAEVRVMYPVDRSLHIVHDRTTHVDDVWQKNPDVVDLGKSKRSTGPGDLIVDNRTLNAWLVRYRGDSLFPRDFERLAL